MPTISVILPVYNAKRHLAIAVESVLEQTFRDFEFIIIDDGSTDGSTKMLREWAARDQRIRLTSRPNKGLVATLNEGLALSRGEYIARMDSDDRCLPRRFEKQVQHLQTHPDVVAVGCRVIAIDADDDVIGLEPLPLAHEDIEKWHLIGSSAICHPAAMMRADVLRGSGGYRDLAPVEDFDLWLRLGEIGQLANLPETLFMYRRTTTGMVAANTHRRMAALEQVLRDAWQRRQLPGEPRLPRHRIRGNADMYQQWAWMAIDCGQPATARKYAWRTLRSRPLAWHSWKLAVCALRRPRADVLAGRYPVAFRPDAKSSG